MNVTLARPSVASLLLQPQFGDQPLSTATGFVAKINEAAFLITNWHVATGRRPDTGAILSSTGGVPNRITVLHNRSGALGSWVPVVEALYDTNGEPRWLEHPTHGRQVDVVALELSELANADIYPYDPSSEGPGVALGVTRPLSIVGFPFGVTGGGALGVWVQGTVATEPTIDFDNRPCFLIDSWTRPGQSGSPVLFYSDGGTVAMADGSTAVFAGPIEQFVGVYSGRISENSDLGFVWKARALVEILEGGTRGAV